MEIRSWKSGTRKFELFELTVKSSLRDFLGQGARQPKIVSNRLQAYGIGVKRTPICQPDPLHGHDVLRRCRA